MGYGVIIWSMYTMSNDQIRVISIFLYVFCFNFWLTHNRHTYSRDTLIFHECRGRSVPGLFWSRKGGQIMEVRIVAQTIAQSWSHIRPHASLVISYWPFCSERELPPSGHRPSPLAFLCPKLISTSTNWTVQGSPSFSFLWAKLFPAAPEFSVRNSISTLAFFSQLYVFQ